MRQSMLSASRIKPEFAETMMMVLLMARPEIRYLRYAVSWTSEPSRLEKGTGMPSAKNPDGSGLEVAV